MGQSPRFQERGSSCFCDSQSVFALDPASLGVALLTIVFPIGLVGALMLGVLSYFEHLRSVRTSFLLNVYLLFTIIFDTARSRTFALVPELNEISILFTTRIGVKVFLAVFEAKGKGSLLLSGYTSYPPEATSGMYNRALFWWQNALLKKGFKNVLSIEDLFHLDKPLYAEYLQRIIKSAWDGGESRTSLQKARSCRKSSLADITRAIVVHHSSNSLLWVTLKQLKWSVLAVVPPRVCLMAFNFCQPFLINRAVSYAEETTSPQTLNIGYGLIGAYVLVYVGIAISTGQYQHFTFRFITMMRGGLVSMLYNKSVEIPLNDVDVASSITLMSADIERIVTGMQTGHEIWANSIEVGLAIYLLKQQLGVACVIPVGVAVGINPSLVITVSSANQLLQYHLVALSLQRAWSWPSKLFG